jgi:hypothetical protein
MHQPHQLRQLREPRELRKLREPQPTPPKSMMADAFNNGLTIIGQGIVYFTMFYCSMNWMYYRGLRKSMEEFKKDKEDKEDDKK